MSEKEIQQVIAQALNRAAEKNQPVILAQAFAFDAQDILAVLTHPADQQTTRIYWEQPSEGFAMAGLNSVLEINPENGEKLSELTGRMCAVLDDVFSDADSTGSRLRFLGGTAFDLKAETDSVWQDFPRMRFVIPECLVIKENQDTQLIISRLVHPGDNPDRILKEFSQTCIYYQNRLPVTLPNISRVGILEQENTPDRATYERKIYSILSELKPGNLEKVVLSRSTCLKLEGHFRITSAMQILRAAYHECTNFFFSFPDEGIFFGSTPERLISKHGNEIKTEALAGTMGRGRNMEEDRQLAEQLMASHKEMEEHMYVVDQIRQRLEPFLTNF
nr:chorismate-binding protein [FCB group bacterium]